VTQQSAAAGRAATTVAPNATQQSVSSGQHPGVQQLASAAGFTWVGAVDGALQAAHRIRMGVQRFFMIVSKK